MTLDGFGGGFLDSPPLWESIGSAAGASAAAPGPHRPAALWRVFGGADPALQASAAPGEAGARAALAKHAAAKRRGRAGPCLLGSTSLDTKDKSPEEQLVPQSAVTAPAVAARKQRYARPRNAPAAKGDRRASWKLPRSEASFSRSVTEWDFTWVDCTTGETFDLRESMAGRWGHEIVCEATVYYTTGRGSQREVRKEVYSHPAGLKEPWRPTEPGSCLGCGVDLEGTESNEQVRRRPADDPRGWVFPGRLDGRRCQACAAALWPTAPVTATYRAPSAAERALGERREEAGARKRRNKSTSSAVGFLARELDCSEDAAGLLLDAGLPTERRRHSIRRGERPAQAEPRLGPLRNKACPCGSGAKMKVCCADEPQARVLAKRTAAQRALVAKLMRVGQQDRAAKVRKCRSRFRCGVCRTPGCTNHGRPQKIAGAVFCCGDRLCPWCAHAASDRLTDRITGTLEALIRGRRVDARWLSSVTLTVTNSQDSIQGAWAWLRAAYRRLLHLVALKFPCPECRGAGRQIGRTPPLVLSYRDSDGNRRKATRRARQLNECQRCSGGGSLVEGGIRCMETTASTEAGYHPHLHCQWIHRTPMPQAALAAAWMIATEGEGYVVDIRRVVKGASPQEDFEAIRDAIRETTKYETKVLEVPDSHIIDVTEALRGEHLRDVFGLMRGVKIDDSQEEEQGVAEVGEEPAEFGDAGDLGSCGDCAAPLVEEIRWLHGRERFRALRQGGERVWPGLMNPQIQRGLPGLVRPPPEWLLATDIKHHDCYG